MPEDVKKDLKRGESEEGMKDTFVAVFFIAGFIILSWVAVFTVYIGRL
ncbi:conserved hypothetical protein [[Clostridium] ultunense Esp]|nr:conserved hypothetical protein [[Clostridium] ultunense Esp]